MYATNENEKRDIIQISELGLIKKEQKISETYDTTLYLLPADYEFYSNYLYSLLEQHMSHETNEHWLRNCACKLSWILRQRHTEKKKKFITGHIKSYNLNEFTVLLRTVALNM